MTNDYLDIKINRLTLHQRKGPQHADWTKWLLNYLHDFMILDHILSLTESCRLIRRSRAHSPWSQSEIVAQVCNLHESLTVALEDVADACPLYERGIEKMIIQTKRLLLRKFTNEDFEDFCEYAIDDEMCRMMGRDMMHSKDDALRNFEWLKDKEERCYGLVDKLSNRVIGNLTVVNVPSELISIKNLKGKNGKSLSFSISKEFQRKGLMQEAILGVIKQLFYEEGMDYIQCGSYPFNKASEALQKKLGFTYLTTLEFKDGDKAVTTNENILWKE